MLVAFFATFRTVVVQHVVLKPLSSNSHCCGHWRGCGRCCALSGMTFSSVDGSSSLPAANLRLSFVLQSLSTLARWCLVCFCAGHWTGVLVRKKEEESGGGKGENVLILTSICLISLTFQWNASVVFFFVFFFKIISVGKGKSVSLRVSHKKVFSSLVWSLILCLALFSFLFQPIAIF